MVNSEDKKLSNFRKISLHGSQKWYSRFNRLRHKLSEQQVP